MHVPILLSHILTSKCASPYLLPHCSWNNRVAETTKWATQKLLELYLISLYLAGIVGRRHGHRVSIIANGRGALKRQSRGNLQDLILLVALSLKDPDALFEFFDFPSHAFEARHFLFICELWEIHTGLVGCPSCLAIRITTQRCVIDVAFVIIRCLRRGKNVALRFRQSRRWEEGVFTLIIIEDRFFLNR